METYTLATPQLQLRVTPQSAAILDFVLRDRDTPLLRPYQQQQSWHPGDSALFPLLPLANRVRDNAFMLHQRQIILPPSPLDADFFLHGDGWLHCWQVATQDERQITLTLSVQQACGFDYDARLSYRLTEKGLEAELSLRHCGDEPMLYGAGFHPYFTKWQDTALQFSASGYWPEGEQHLPLAWQGSFVPELDFNQGQIPANRWLNLGYSGWPGEATLQTPSQRLHVTLRSSLAYLMLFQLADGQFICLEPQSHPVDAHHLPGQPGLVLLRRGEALHAAMQISVRRTA